MGIIVIVAYRPLPGCVEALEAVLLDHVPILRGEGLATQREPVLMRAKDGAYVEVFEWVSEEAIEAAHKNPVVGAMWERFGAACTFENLADLEESKALFSSFAPVN